MLEIVKEPKHWAANDPINRHLGVLARRDGWNQECDKARYALEAELKRRGFIEFDGTPQHYGLWLLGEHLEYQVPADRQGHLAVFRGQRIKMFCTRAGHNRRWYFAGPIYRDRVNGIRNLPNNSLHGTCQKQRTKPSLWAPKIKKH